MDLDAKEVSGTCQLRPTGRFRVAENASRPARCDCSFCGCAAPSRWCQGRRSGGYSGAEALPLSSQQPGRPKHYSLHPRVEAFYTHNNGGRIPASRPSSGVPGGVSPFRFQRKFQSWTVCIIVRGSVHFGACCGIFRRVKTKKKPARMILRALCYLGRPACLRQQGDVVVQGGDHITGAGRGGAHVETALTNCSIRAGIAQISAKPLVGRSHADIGIGVVEGASRMHSTGPIDGDIAADAETVEDG